MKHIFKTTLLMLLAVVSQSFGAALNLSETWSASNAVGWVKYDAVNETKNVLAVESNALKLVFSSPDTMPPDEYVFKAPTNASGGNFTGDYVQQGVTEISFRLFCGGAVDEVNLMLWSEGRIWRYEVPKVQTGAWLSVRVPVALPTMYSFAERKLWSLFESSLRNVTAVGVKISRTPDGKAAVYRLDDFMLTGVGPDFAGWMASFTNQPGYGTGNCSVVSGADLDGDGSLNIDEWIAGTSAGDENDRFRIFIESGPSSPHRLRWTSAPGRKYQIWSTEDLGVSFVPAGPKLDAPTNTFEVMNTDGTMPSFYRVTVEKPSP